MARYVDDRKLGSGGFGEVWLCTRDSDGAEFAKKKLVDSSDTEAVSRFQREVRLQSRLDHPNIVKVVGIHLGKAPYWYVMPLYKHALLNEIPAITGDEERIVKVFSAILSGIEYAHSEGVIHRDLKPENVLINDDDDVVVTDFGLGRALDSNSTRDTETGIPLGTFLFMAPEQMTNAKKADERSDVYSLGRMLLEMFIGKLGSTATDTSALEDGIAHVIEKCTRTMPGLRYQTVTELKKEFQLVMGVTQALSPHEEIDDLMSVLVSSSSPRRKDVVRILDLIAQNRSDTDMVHEFVMNITPKIATLILAIDKVNARQLIDLFTEYATSQSWGFSYTDKIGAHCQRLYEAMDDPKIRANLIFCVLEVGYGHNRWNVMAISEKLFEKKHSVPEALAIAEKINEVSVRLRKELVDRLSLTKINPTIVDALQKNLPGEDEGGETEGE